jgi:hypothetical protein
MIYLFTGGDTKAKHKAYENFIKSIPKNVEIFPIIKNDLNPMELESFYSGSGLFFKKCAVILTDIFEYENTRELVLEKLNLMGESDNDFIFLEDHLNKPVLDIFQKAKAEVNIFELSKEKKEKFNNFLLANAFGDRDKLNLWIYFRQAMDKGVGMEELIGVLFWKAKDMILKKNFRKFSEVELVNFADKISYLLPESRKKGQDDETAFEQFLLEAF